jgi:hypothetical protein
MLLSGAYHVKVCVSGESVYYTLADSYATSDDANAAIEQLIYGEA